MLAISFYNLLFWTKFWMNTAGKEAFSDRKQFSEVFPYFFPLEKVFCGYQRVQSGIKNTKNQ